MIHKQYKIKCSGNAKTYGIRNGDWVNHEVFKIIKKDVRSKGEEDVFYSAIRICNNDEVVKQIG